MVKEEFNFDEKRFEKYVPFHRYFMRRKAFSIKRILPKGAICLDIGCGSGTMEKLVHDHFCEIAGLDPSLKQIEKAKGLGLNNCKFEVGSSGTLPYKENSFDSIIMVNMMHHVAPEEHIRTINEAFRVLKKGGTILIYEHNPLNPLVYIRFYFFSIIDKDAQMIKPSLMKRYLIDVGFKGVKINWMISEVLGEYFVYGKK